MVEAKGAEEQLAARRRARVLELLPENGAPIDQLELQVRSGMGRKFWPALCALATQGAVIAWEEGGRHWVRRRSR